MFTDSDIRKSTVVYIEYSDGEYMVMFTPFKGCRCSMYKNVTQASMTRLNHVLKNAKAGIISTSIMTFPELMAVRVVVDTNPYWL